MSEEEIEVFNRISDRLKNGCTCGECCDERVLINIIKKYKKQNKSLKDENNFLRFMYKGTEEYKAVERHASGDHIPRID